MTARMKRAAIAVLFCGALVSCGNDTQQVGLLKQVRQTAVDRLSPAAGPQVAGPSAAQIRMALGVMQQAGQLEGKSVKIATLEQPPLSAAMIESGRNGDVITYQTPDRIALALRDGVLISTRGFGDDLMSADVSELLAALHGPRPRQATRVHRYLDAENHEVLRSFACVVEGGRQVTETCHGDGISFTNSYVLDGAGAIVQSRQWVGPRRGSIRIDGA